MTDLKEHCSRTVHSIIYLTADYWQKMMKQPTFIWPFLDLKPVKVELLTSGQTRNVSVVLTCLLFACYPI